MSDSLSQKYGAPLAAAGLSAFAWGLFGLAMYGRVTGWDLAPLFIGATLVGRGQIDRLYDHDPMYFDLAGTQPWVEEAGRIALGWDAFPYVYPPLWAAVLAPIAGVLEFDEFKAIVTAVHVAALGSAVFLVAIRWAPIFLQPIPLGLLIVAMFFSRPVFDGLVLGQIQPIVILGVIIAIAASQARRPALAGAALAVAAALKLIPAVLAIYWLLTGRRDCVLWFVAIGAILGLLSLALAGWSAHVAFLDSLAWIGRSLVFGLNNQSLPTWLGHFAVPTGELFQYRALPAPFLIRALSSALALTSLVAAVAIARSRDLDTRTDAALMLALMLAVTMALPIAWHHYYVLLMAPAMLLVQSGTRGVPIVIAGLVSMWLYPFGRALALSGSTVLAWNELAAGALCLAALAVQIARPVPALSPRPELSD